MYERLKQMDNNMPQLLAFYQRFYNNVIEIDMSKSKWYVEDRAIKEINESLKSR